MPVTFKPAAHAANSFQDAAEITSINLMELSCLEQWDTCDEILQSFIGRGPDATSDNLHSAHIGLVSTILSAYNEHHALILRPDDVWLAILVQFNFYVNAHAEELRDKFVAHEGKKQVVVHATGNRFDVDFGALAKCMTGEMDKFIVDSALKEWILPRFSTTTDNDTVVAAVLMMATLKEYFSYKMSLACGIPRVTLEGEKSDWEEILQRASKLKEYGKETAAWYMLLEPVLTRFVRAFDAPDADENLDFWQRIASIYNQGSGPTYLSGWITAFCAFSAKGKWLGLPLDSINEDNAGTIHRDSLTLDGAHYHWVDTSDVPLGHAAVDVLLDDNGTEFDTSMVAGLVATRVSDSGDTSLSENGVRDTVSPVAGWWIFTKRSGMSRREEEMQRIMARFDDHIGKTD